MGQGGGGTLQAVTMVDLSAAGLVINIKIGQIAIKVNARISAKITA